ncbi:MAG TPA: sigma factor [Vicinamibacterales bacterium]|nr:sigma factor [Vicinamibacterales bacterium]
MDGSARSLVGPILGVDADLEREFEIRLVESSTLAFRVAYGVLRNRADAEEVAQEAFVRAHRRFAQLRDRMPARQRFL